MYNAEHCILVRAYGNKPVLMHYFVNDDGDIMVYRQHSDQAIPYAREYLYETDRELLDALTVAHSAGDKQSLNNLWAGAKRFVEQ